MRSGGIFVFVFVNVNRQSSIVNRYFFAFSSATVRLVRLVLQKDKDAQQRWAIAVDIAGALSK
jgi:hypothetical protein